MTSWKFCIQLLFLYVIVGVLFVWPVWKRQTLASTGAQQPISNAAQPSENSLNKPQRLIVPDLGLAIAIAPGSFENSQWVLSSHQVHFAVMTALPNSKAGNTLIYGHNTHGVFGDLAQLRTGAEARVETESGLTFVYQLQNSDEVTPTDVSILNYQGPPRLTLLTCSGLTNARRHQYYFKLDRILQ